MTGSCLPDDLLNKIDSRVANVASRKISGLPYITRIEALHFVAGTRSIRNPYRHHCGQFLHQVLLCEGGGVRYGVYRELCALLRMDTLETAVWWVRLPHWSGSRWW